MHRTLYDPQTASYRHEVSYLGHSESIERIIKPVVSVGVILTSGQWHYGFTIR